jgi:hypothetical protein
MGTPWKVQASAEPVQEGDIICLLEKAKKPHILRLCGDHLTVIAVSVASQENTQGTNTLESLEFFPTEFSLAQDKRHDFCQR